MIDHYCQSCCQVPRCIVLDVDDTFDDVHGGQQLRLVNAQHDEYGFQPIVVFDGEGRMIAAVLRPAQQIFGQADRALAAPTDHRDPRPVATGGDHVARL